MLKTPFYNPNLSYEDNYDQGPFGDFIDPDSIGVDFFSFEAVIMVLY